MIATATPAQGKPVLAFLFFEPEPDGCSQIAKMIQVLFKKAKR
jgi:hypothetical protein